MKNAKSVFGIINDLIIVFYVKNNLITSFNQFVNNVPRERDQRPRERESKRERALVNCNQTT